MKTKTVVTLVLLAAALISCGGNKHAKSPVALHWTAKEQNTGTGIYRQVYTLKNIGDKELDKGWTLYFCQLPYKVPEQAAVQLAVEEICSTYYRIFPAETYTAIPAGGETTLTVDSYYRVFKDCQAPEGAFIVMADGGILPVEITADPILLPDDGALVYEANSTVKSGNVGASAIIPQPGEVIHEAGSSIISSAVTVEYPEEFSAEAAMLIARLEKESGMTVSSSGQTNISLTASPAGEFGAEGYSMSVRDDGITVAASTPAGMFYGTQSLLSMIRGREFPLYVPNFTINDSPDFGYRGQMIDIVRTYASKEQLMELVDLFASYKLNVLHFHFSDDEGWRVEIPGLPELTEVGARRGYTLDEHDMLYPAYEGGAEPAANQFLTRQDFIDLLKYAAKRHVEVVPEIESPGHARAALVSMDARYRKYIDTDPEKAREYLLRDYDDASVYDSAQYYTDDVMCVGLPSVYRFMEKVVDELALMYRDAGLTLRAIHVGGDEVAHGAWTGSPVCKAFMEKEGIPSFERLAEYYIIRVNDILKERGIKMAGWQELVLERSNDFHRRVMDNVSAVHCWHTIGHNARMPYELAELGYPVLLSNVTNLYFDMAYTGHPEEPGHWWGAFVDERASFSTHTYNDIDNVIGLEGTLFGETIRGYAMRQFQLFPKILGLADRSWNAAPEWMKPGTSADVFDSAYGKFNSIVTKKELPWLNSRGVNFHIPRPGIFVENGLLFANSTIEDSEIRYTTDGSTPTVDSPLWTKSVKCDAAEVRARLFYLGKESATTVWRAR